jgi:hypothetical protein
MTPRPPACAMAIAIPLSVTVSMADDRIGRLSAMSLVTRERISTSVGSTSERAGCNSTSSNVRAASPVMEETIFAKGRPFLPRVSEMRNPPPGESPVSGLARVNSIGVSRWKGQFGPT